MEEEIEDEPSRRDASQGATRGCSGLDRCAPARTGSVGGSALAFRQSHHARQAYRASACLPVLGRGHEACGSSMAVVRVDNIPLRESLILLLPFAIILLSRCCEYGSMPYH